MRKLLYLILGVIVLASCDLHTYSNGKLDGFWHLKEIDTLSTGGVEDLSRTACFWGVEGKLINVGNGNIFFLHQRYRDTLRLYHPYIHDWHEDSLLKNTDLVKAFGINFLDDRFKILHLNENSMILRDSLLQLDFEKY
ncbi:MAG: lipocalin-like domain-containing protein [Prevotella sp.]|jgi:hypothetical protein|nr:MULTISPECIES: lipocalin-like domain-containing protein [unclassified Prevotella]MCH3969005.1 lipocalin-like domain-containing protein [Prevotella sp.]MCH3992153.1 lipocalin-like domain-containing protein [Prevotella sp.]MCH4017269.1 lipocalin-like domain-containing protein [Prevotella sp.]MCH4099810.1 lipocalin-like domain-containing protein [Prevotella sp.]MCH4186898.1 lipocalin-like domain-containing protein [Prevotella sp.]